MVQFVASGDTKSKFFFNVDTPVGAGAKGSRRADILLVQFYFVIHHHATGKTGDAYRKVRLTGVCDEDLIAAIRAYQAAQGERLAQDGLVSRARGARFDSGPGWKFWTIVGMSLGFWAFTRPMFWPRIDKHPQCNSELGQAVRDALGA